MLSHVKAQKKDGDLHTGMEGFWQEDDMVQIPLAVLSKWNSIFCKDNEMYIVENPSVFAGLCAGHTKQVSCMCMNGQPRLAGLVTLDLLAASGTVVYYAGDLDPEGLLIAQKISEYYAGEFHYWHMTVEDYEKSKSNETISEKRIKSLERITDTELFPVAEKMRLDRLAGQPLTVYGPHGMQPGVGCGIDARGALRVEAGGRITAVHSGEVSVRAG